MMTDTQRYHAIIDLIEKHTAASIVSKSAARDSLIDTGIYTRNGRLKPEFGGKPGKKQRAA